MEERNVESDGCKIFRLLKIEASKEEECSKCPFSNHCPEDLGNDYVASILKLLGDYLKSQN